MHEPDATRPPHELDYGELPELTRALRALGSTRRSAGATQTAFFRPLLDARRKAEEARSAVARVRAFDSAELSRALERWEDRLVAESPDPREPARRAVRAALDERLREYRDAIGLLGEAGQRVLAADSDTVLAAWRSWTDQLRRVFHCADRSWLAIHAVVESLTARKTR